MRFAGVAAVLVLCETQAFAQTNPDPPWERHHEPVTVDSVVREPMLIASSSVEPYVGMQLQAGVRTDKSEPFVGIQGTLEQAAISMSPQLGIGVTPWALLYGGATGTTLTGLNGATLVGRGADVSGGAFVGGVVSLVSKRVEDPDVCACGFRVSLNGRLGRNFGESLLVERLLTGVAADPTNVTLIQGTQELATAAGRLAVSYTESHYRLDLAGSYAWAHHFWLQGAIGGEYVDRRYDAPAGLRAAPLQMTTEQLPRIGFGFGADPRSPRFPLAAMIEYQVTINQTSLTVTDVAPQAGSPPRITEGIMAFEVRSSSAVLKFFQLGLGFYYAFGISDSSIVSGLQSPRAHEIGCSTMARYAW